MKKVVALLMTVLLTALGCAALAEMSGDWWYVVLDDGTVEITEYFNKDATVVALPDELDGKPVTSIHSSAFSHCIKLTKIKVASTHSTFASIDGVLYHRLTKTLVCLPTG